MGILVQTSNVSLDGYMYDENRNFDFGEPSEEVHAFINDLERPLGTYLYGRKLYETMAVWETIDAGDSDVTRDYAQLWRAADKIIYSTTLTEVVTERTRIERSFDVDAVRALKESSPADLGIGGPHLAWQALKAGLVDQLRMFVYPYVVGGGTRALPDGWRQPLHLLEERRFESGVVFLRYAVG